MAPKKRPATTPRRRATPPLREIPIVLNEHAMADLKYLEPTRTRQRMISIVNELFVRVQALERLHPEKPTRARKRSL